jgi:hypothetical protein
LTPLLGIFEKSLEIQNNLITIKLAEVLLWCLFPEEEKGIIIGPSILFHPKNWENFGQLFSSVNSTDSAKFLGKKSPKFNITRLKINKNLIRFLL